MKDSPVRFQVDPASLASLPSWMEEVAAMAHILAQTGIISAIEEHVRFARARFGNYDTIDFGLVLLGYALSGEATIQAFYERSFSGRFSRALWALPAPLAFCSVPVSCRLARGNG